MRDYRRAAAGGLVLALAILPVGTVGADAAVSGYPTSDGSAGACVLDSDIDTTTGGGLPTSSVEAGNGLPDRRVVQCTTITVPAGANVRVTGSAMLDLRAQGDVTIDGGLNVSANNRNPGAGGGTGGATGGGVATDGSGPGKGHAGALFVNGGAGGAGGTAYGDPPGTVGVLGQSATTTGSGGGGGGAGSGGGVTAGSGGGGGAPANAGTSTGGAGGGGGGGLRITSPTAIVIGSAGMVQANGGNGAPGGIPIAGDPTGGSGGGGSGGALTLIAPVIDNSGALRAIGGAGGPGVTAGAASGGAGADGVIHLVVDTLPGAGTSQPSSVVDRYSYGLQVTRAGSGHGVVTSSPAGIVCGADCVEVYSPGAEVTLSALPDPGSTFAGWSGGGCSGLGDCLVRLDAAVSVVATFTAPLPQDTTPPTVTITDHPRAKVRTRHRHVRVGFSFMSEAGASFTCRIDSSAYQPCSSPRTYRVGRGTHDFSVRATDAAHNTGPAAFFHFKVVKKKR